MDENIQDSLAQHQIRAEWEFAAAVYLAQNPTQEVGWLKPETLQQPQVRRFWEEVLQGIEPPKAAIDAGIYLELIKYMTGLTFSSIYLGSFAQAIADDVYLNQVTRGLSSLARLIADRRTSEIRSTLVDMAQADPQYHLEGQESIEASLEFLADLDDRPTTIPTGIAKLDTSFGGWSRQTLNILAARPSMGKTAMALQFARACVDAGGTCLYFSIEMSRKAIWSRMVCGDAKVDHRKYKQRSWTPEEYERCLESNRDLQGRYGERFIIDERSHVTTADIWRSTAQYKPDLLVVDHLGLVADEAENNILRVGKIAWSGKQIAKEHNCASLYLCQLNRGVEQREVKVPNMSDLRDSGEIEQDADVVLFIHRGDYYETTITPPTVSPTDLVLAKDREGARSIQYKLNYHLIEQRFLPPEEQLQAHSLGAGYNTQPWSRARAEEAWRG